MENKTISFKEIIREGNFGLENYGKSKMPNCVDVIQPAKNPDGRWRTGLDELSMEISAIPDAVERDTKREDVKAKRESLERVLGKDLSGTSSFWESFYIELNPKKPLDLNSPLDQVKYSVLLNHRSVAPSIKKANSPEYSTAKFYLSREFEEVSDRLEKKKRYNKAVASLDEIMENPDKAISIANYLGLYLKPNTPQDNIYDALQTYLDKDETLDSVKKFLNAINLTPEEIQVKLIFDEAVKHRVIIYTSGLFQRGSITLGDSSEKAIRWLSDPINSGELISIQEETDRKRKFG